MTVTLVIALLGLYLLIGEPLLGHLSYRRMLAKLETGTPGARARFYLQWVWQGWVLMAVTLAITLGLAGWTPAQLGLRLPYWPHRPVVDHGGLAGFAVGAAAAIVIGVAAGVVAARKKRRHDSDTGQADPPRPALAGSRDLMQMLPRTRGERSAFAALAVTAGVTEEVIWRGFGLTLLFALLPSLHPAVPIALAAVAFGWAHFYQGSIGMLATALLGAVFATLFWASGSLLWPIVLHTLIDLRVLLVRTPAHQPQGGTP